MTDTKALAHLVCCDANLALCGEALTGGANYTEDDETPTCLLCSIIDDSSQPCGAPGCEVGGDDPDADLEDELVEPASWTQAHPRRPVARVHLAARPAAHRPASIQPVKRRPPLRGVDHRHTRPGRRRET